VFNIEFEANTDQVVASVRSPCMIRSIFYRSHPLKISRNPLQFDPISLAQREAWFTIARLNSHNAQDFVHFLL
jgi:hypothetical protein